MARTAWRAAPADLKRINLLGHEAHVEGQPLPVGTPHVTELLLYSERVVSCEQQTRVRSVFVTIKRTVIDSWPVRAETTGHIETFY